MLLDLNKKPDGIRRGSNLIIGYLFDLSIPCTTN